MRRCGKKKLSFVFIFCSQAFIKERFMRSKRTCFCFPQTVICYLLSVPQKKSFLETVNCQLSRLVLMSLTRPCDIIRAFMGCVRNQRERFLHYLLLGMQISFCYSVFRSLIRFS